MEPIANHQMLELTYQPAFSVRDGIIAYANQAALQRQVSVGTPMESLLCDNQEEYAAFREGCLYLPMSISGVRYSATLLWLDHQQIVLLDPEDAASELQALSLAARELREPLTRIMTLSESLFSDLESAPETHSRIAGINRGFYQLLRLVGNMSDAGSRSVSRPELQDVTSVLQEIFDEAGDLCGNAGVTLTFRNLPAGVYSLIDSSRLERAIYNILSNSLKFTPAGGQIQAQLDRRGNTLYLSMTDSGPGIDFNVAAQVFRRYCREPGIEDSRYGIGLGMSLIRAAAVAHGGTVLLDRNKNGGSRITLSLPIRQDISALRSPVMRIDYAGERNHGLIELSDSLPNELYGPRFD